MKISLNDRHALVCGASQGIGAAIAAELAQAGARLTLVARNEEKLKQMVSKLEGSGHSLLRADFLSDQDVSSVSDYCVEHKVDILVNNTGGPSPGEITEATISVFERAMKMHLHASHTFSQACLQHMKSQRFGRIINIISTSVKIPIAGLGVSNTTRAAMAGWSKTLSGELAPFGITVNNILPGFIDTDRLGQLINKLSEDGNLGREEVVENMLKSVPAGKFGLPEQIGHLGVFLSSEYASYITGESIRVDGGKTGSI
ncbi:MAG: SDR family oxidoreductase [Cyclobacteriaceae bacterium]